MARSNQVLTEDQPDMFGPEPTPVYQPNLDKVRARLHKILMEVRAAEPQSWEPSTLSLYRTIFPQMAQFLPEQEGAKLHRDFETELARLDPA